MKKVATLVVIWLMCILTPPAAASVPAVVTYQGYLKSSDGTPATGSVSIAFSLYDVAAGGTPLWNESQTVALTSGVYSVLLGSVTPLSLPFDQQYYLGVKVGTAPELSPRQILSSTPYAFRSAASDTSEKLGGKIAADFLLAADASSIYLPSTFRTTSQSVTGVFTFNPSSGSVPFAVGAGKTGVVSNLNAEMVGGKKLGDLDGRYGNAVNPVPTAQQVATLRWDQVRSGDVAVSVGGVPYGLAFDGSSIWTTTGSGNSVRKISVATGVLGDPITVGSFPIAVAYDGTSIWVTNSTNNTIQKINVLTGAVGSPIAVGTNPRALAFDGMSIWVANYGSNTVQKINISTGTAGAPIAVGLSPTALAYDGASIWVANGGSSTVQKINPSTGALGSPLAVGEWPWAFAFDGSSLWVANRCGNSVQKIDVGAGTVGAPIAVGSGPSGIAFDGSNIWVVSAHNNCSGGDGKGTLQKIDRTTGVAGAEIQLGFESTALVFDGANLWVGNITAGSVKRLAAAGVPVGLQSVGAAQIVDGSVTTAEIADGAVTAAKIGGILPISVGGTGGSTASSARANLGAAASGPNSDITSLGGLTTPLFVAQGGTGATTAAAARTSLGVPGLATPNTFTAAPQTMLTGAAGTKGFLVKGASGQTANLQEWQDASGGTLASVSAGGVFASNVATGTAPLQVASTTLVPNLNAEMVGGQRLWDLDGRYAPANMAHPSTTQLALLRWDQVQGSGQVKVGSSPFCAAFDGTHIWVANFTSNTVTKVRASDGARIGDYPTGTAPFCVAFDGSNVWITNYKGSSVTKLRAADGSTIGTYSVGLNPFGIVFDGTNMWVANAESNTVTKLASDGTIVGNYPVGAIPRNLAFDGTNIWVTHRATTNNVTKLRASDGLILGTYTAGINSYGIAFDGTNVWVANFEDKSVSKIRASDGVKINDYPTGAYPRAVVFDGKNVWVTNEQNVTKIRASDGAKIGDYSVPTPFCAVFDGANVWVTDGNSTITRIPADSGSTFAAASLSIADGAVTSTKIADGSITSAKLTIDSNLNMHDKDISFRGDVYHGLGWYGSGKLWSGSNINGPVLYGGSGGALGTTDGTTQKTALIWDTTGAMAKAPFKLMDNDLLLRGDANHGLGWYGSGKLFSATPIDGPVLYGWSGGALGTMAGGQKGALLWYSDQRVWIPKNLDVSGTLSKGSGSFKIDHPLDPRNRYLYHSFVESPDMMNIYNGTVTTDGSGYATVELPAWFESLNSDFRYQLTVIDEKDSADFTQAKIVKKVSDNRFTLRTSVPAVTVSWQVTGIRKDAYANDHRIKVEEDKPEGEKGTCLHPEACSGN